MGFRKITGWALAASLVLGVPALTAALGDTSSPTGSGGGAGMQERLGIQPTATGTSGTSMDSTSETGRGSSYGEMGTRGGAQDIGSDTMQRGVTFQGMSSAPGTASSPSGGGEGGY